MNVLVLGGTAEARLLATELHDRPGIAVTSSLAGGVAVPARPPGAVRVGGFGGVDGLRQWLIDHRVDAVVDATHPFAGRITANAVAATADGGVALLVLRRAGWTEGPGDRWHRVPDAATAAALLPRLGERVFLALGRGNLAAFASHEQWFLLRAVEPPPPPRPPRHHLVLGRGPFTVDAERALLGAHRVEVVVARDSGGTMTAAKLVAARQLGLPVVLLDRPPPLPRPVPTVATVAEAVHWVLATAAPANRVTGGTTRRTTDDAIRSEPTPVGWNG